MSTGYGWEGIRQVCATLLGHARHVPERLCGGSVYLGAITSARPIPFYHLGIFWTVKVWGFLGTQRLSYPEQNAMSKDNRIHSNSYKMSIRAA